MINSPSSDGSYYKRILLKLSGEALMGANSYGIDPNMLKGVAEEIRDIHNSGTEIAIVIGGGNIFRGLNSEKYGMRRVQADHMGMLATLINCIALGEFLNTLGTDACVMSAVEMPKFAESYITEKAIKHLDKKRIVLIGAGTGNPFFSTDTAATLRAIELEAEILLKATKVDGVYDSDPTKDKNAKPFGSISYHEFLKRNLKVMDMTAVSLAMGQNLPIIVFNLLQTGNMKRVVFKEQVGTVIGPSD